jgi:hypothetical protein
MSSTTFVRLSPCVKSPQLEELLGFCVSLMPLGLNTGHEPAGAYVRLDAPGIDSPSSDNGPGLTLLVPRSPASNDEAQRVERMVRFAASEEVPSLLRGKSTRLRLPPELQTLALGLGERPLATAGDAVLWSVLGEGINRTFRTALPIPCLASAAGVTALADADGLLDWVPLIHFLREATWKDRFENPPLRASFVIDDPNLHWPRYGFANYKEIAADATKHCYHVSFATIPLDAWFTHQASAAIFREQLNQLSLAIHGNNHTRDELARVSTRHAGAALLRQAIDRISVLEAAARVDVCRVMVPPHGACSSSVLAQLPAQGFEAACVSAGSLRAHNPNQAWTRTLGMAPSELVAGCPVLPRWAFASSTEASLLLAAYLGKPLILRGHHQDLKSGLDVFRSFARLINSLGPVRWGSLSELGRMNYRWRQEGQLLRIAPLGVRVDVRVPQDVQDVVIEPSAYRWTLTDGAHADSSHLRLDADPSVRRLTIQRHAVRESETPGAPAPRTRPRFVIRRLLTEARDRLLA